MELTNSKRLMSTASWVTVKLDTTDQERIARKPSGALRKANFLLSINLQRESIERIAAQIEHREEADTRELRQTLAIVRQMADKKLSHLQFAEALSPISAAALVNFSLLLPENAKPSSFDLMVELFEQQHQVSPIGWLHLERLEMFPVGVERGELVYTVPLAPGETQTISHKEWSTSAQEYEQLVQDYFESYSERGVAEKTDASMSTENESRRSKALNFGATLSGSYGGTVSLTTTFGLSTASEERNSVRQSLQRNREVTEKASARARQEHKVSVKLETRKGTEDSSFKTISNSSAEAVRIDYYRMMRKWRTDMYRYGLRLTYDITIPTPGARFWARWQRISQLDLEIAVPFVFTTTPAEITDATWSSFAAQYGVGVEPPADPSITLTNYREMEDGKWGDPLFEFVAPEGYEISTAAKGTIAFWGPPGYPTFVWGGPASLQETGPNAGSQSGHGLYEVTVEGTGGDQRMAVTLYRSYEYRLAIVLKAGAKRRTEVFEAWRMRVWTALRDAAFARDQQRKARLQEERDTLYRLLVGKDTLSLRQLEREEMLRLIMLWLLGAGSWYSNAPDVIDTIVQQIASNETALFQGIPALDANSPTFTEIDSTEWSQALVFGEIVRYVHQAIEWESLLYFLYPYYWGSEVQGRQKLLFEHPDPEHQRFLRAGYVRAVITVRPGFEEDFVKLMETGTLSGQTQYQSVAQDIYNTARTNYSGIPPANPEKHARPLLLPQQRNTWATMQTVILALDNFYNTNKKYPDKLSELPAGTPTKDAWGRDFTYTYPGSGNDYDLVSYGSDGLEGGTGADADISAAAGASLVATWFDYTPTSGIDVVVGTKPDEIA